MLREFREGARRRGSRQHEGGKEITAVAFVVAALPPAAAQQHAHCDGEEAGSVPAGEQSAAEQQERGGQPADAQQPMQVGAGGSSEGYSELSEHALLSMQAQRASQAQAAAAEASAADSSDSRADDAPNLVLATGWCRALCVWEEGEERVCESSRRLPGHAADVLSLAPLGPHVAATGERGCRVGRGVGIDLFSGHGVGGGAAWHLQHTCTRSALLSLPPLLAGDFEGEVRVWHLPTGACLAAFSYGGAQFERAVRKLCWLPGGSGGSGASARWPLLVACGEDGGMQAWAVELPAGVVDGSSGGSSGAGCLPSSLLAAGHGEHSEAAASQAAVPCRLLVRVAAAHRPQDCITAACVGHAAGGGMHIWTGDSSGHVALWDLSGLAAAAAHESGSPAAQLEAAPADAPVAPAVLRRLAHWRAAEAAIVSLDPLAPSQGLLLVGAQDASVSVWTQAGGLVGVFGKHAWDLGAPATWQDPQALAAPPPLPLDAGGSGLTPRELIASTPQRSSWVARSGSGTSRSYAGSGAASARHLGGGGSASGSALPSARGLGAAAAQGSGRAELQAAAPGSAKPRLEGLAEALSSLAQLRLPIAEEPGEGSDGSSGVDLAARSAAAGSATQQGTSQLPATAEQGGAGAGSCDPLANPAGARLAALAAEAAARKADRWAIPVHVQAHSALALQRMEAVPVDTGGRVAGEWAAAWWRSAHIGFQAHLLQTLYCNRPDATCAAAGVVAAPCA